MIRDKIFYDVTAEANRADFKHGAIPLDPNRAFVVLAREVGEVADALPHPNSERKKTLGTSEHLYTELVQVASVALRWADRVKDDIELQQRSEA